ncbi:MAG: ATP-binding cassette domain-containing protein [Armatimonadetes bacterium]|nr:ATP-binding cassette domain-containing protein [Armatimonadota bacterium]
MTGSPYIDFRSVEVTYNKYVTALKGVSFTVSRGEFLFLLGRTGSGKSTILKLLSREVRETKGLVLFDGQDLGELKESEIPMLRRKMGIVPQDYGLLPRKRAWENIGYAMRAVGRTKKEVRRSVGGILESVNIGHRADAFPSELSGGEQQRLAIARALINSPVLILADEPTGNLDPQHSTEIIQVLQKLNQAGATVLVATHDMSVVEQFGGRILTLDSGTIVSDEVRNA